MLNCSAYSLKSHISYHGDAQGEGQLFFIKTNDSTALTIEKFKDLNKVAYKKIYYSDKESIIYEDSQNNIAVIYFKYLKDKKVFAVYYRRNENFFAKSPEKDILDLSVTRLRMAKNLFKKRKKINQPNWNIYKNSLSNLEVKKLKSSFKEETTSIDSLNSNGIRTKFDLFSSIMIDEKGKQIWNVINKLSKDKFIDSTTFDNYMHYLHFFNAKSTIKVEFKDSSTFILKKKDENGSLSKYGIFKKAIIKDSSVLLYNSFATKINSKEMAYFYFSLVNNYKSL